MKKQLLLLLVSVILLSACEAEPTLAPATPFLTAFTPTSAPVLLPAPTSPNDSRTPAITDNPRPPAAAALPSPTVGSDATIRVASVGTPSREITALPEFIARALYDSLLRVNPKDGSLMPGLASRWTISEDAKTFTFVLRENVKWHDGTLLTPDDVVFTLNALSNPKVRVNPAADFGPIAAVEATDAHTVRITFREAYCAALTYIGTVNILPAHMLEGKNLSAVENENLIGTGPLILKNWQDTLATFTANGQYWDGAPQVRDWTFRMFSDERAAYEALRQKQIDVLAVSAEQTGTPGITFSANEFYGLALNTARPPLDDPRIRQALASALDKSAFVRGLGTNLESSLLPSDWAYPTSIAPQNFDAARARQLFADAGWRDSDDDGILDKDGKPFEVTLWALVEEPRSETAAQLAREQLARVGVRAVLKMTDRILFLTRVFLHEYDLALVHFNIPLDPDQHYFWSKSENRPGFGLNVTNYSNTRVEDALLKGNQVARCDPNARKTAYEPVFQEIAREVPMVFLFAPTHAVSTNAQWEEIAPSSYAGVFWNLNAWQVAP